MKKLHKPNNIYHMQVLEYKDYIFDIYANFDDFTYEVYIQNKKYGVKMLCLGIPLNKYSINYVIDRIEITLENNIECYKEKFEN